MERRDGGREGGRERERFFCINCTCRGRERGEGAKKITQ